MNLSIIIPTLNEEKNLSLLMKDINLYQDKKEVIVIDANSKDRTTEIAASNGAKVISIEEANRGVQMHTGALNSTKKWLLFIHADSRMPDNWPEVLKKIIQNPKSDKTIWFFKFKIDSKGLFFRIMEIGVWLRSNILKKPYGDQGLLISKSIYQKSGGFAPLYIMEDLELILRISKTYKIKSIGIPLYTNSRRWKNNNIVFKILQNQILRYKWQRGTTSKDLHNNYYKNKEN